MKCALPLLLVASLPLHAQGLLYDFSAVGHSVAGPGDVDGDGVPDLMVWRAPLASNGWTGRVEVRSGASGALIHAYEQSSLDDGFGHALTGLGDIDGDSLADFALSVPRGALLGGASFVRWYSGGSGQLLVELVNTGGLTAFGYALAGGGDVDGDGVPDLLIGTPRYLDDGNPGRVEVIDALSGAVLRVHQGSGPSAASFGSALAFVGDLDLDGRVDYAVGSGFLGNGNARSGALTVFSGTSGAVLHHIEGTGSVDALGASIVALDDIDGDGVPELVVGAPGEFQATWVTGAVRVYSGASGALLHHVVQVWGIQFGSSVVAVGDVDGDGVADFGAHFPWAYIGGVLRNVGSVMIHSGADASLLTGWTVGYVGPVVGAGDVNSDGALDLLIGGGSSAVPISASVILGQTAEIFFTPACPAQINSAGCDPLLTWSGGPSLGTGPGLSFEASQLIGQQPGLFIYGPPAAPTPFGGGTLCVGPPVRRTPVQQTGGGPGLDCGGSMGFTFDGAFLSNNGLLAGSALTVQAWTRDPGGAPGARSSLSNAVSFTVWP